MKVDIAGRLGSPDIANLLGRDPDLWRAVHRSGGTIAPNGEPLTITGRRRIRRWRQDWLGLPSQVIPAVVGPDQILRSGTEALHCLARLAGTGKVPPRRPARAKDEQSTGSHRVVA